jgi:ABC-2 type transport system permease protein
VTAPVVAQTKVELALTARRGESILLMVGIPVVLLVFFSAVDVLPGLGDDPVQFLAPGILALAVMSTSMVALGIATGFERQYGVLKRLGATPLTRPALVGAKIASVLAVQAIQVLLLGGVALLLGWEPSWSGIPGAVLGVVLGTVAFSGLGLLMAGTLRGEITLAAANGAYLVLLLVGGMVVPLTELPGALRTVAEMLPAAALADVLHGTIGDAAGVPARAWAVLGVWALVTPALAGRLFRWE